MKASKIISIKVKQITHRVTASKKIILPMRKNKKGSVGIVCMIPQITGNKQRNKFIPDTVPKESVRKKCTGEKFGPVGVFTLTVQIF